MKALFSLLITLAAFSAIAQNRDTDPCYAFRPEELAALPDGVCSEVRGGVPSRNDSNHSSARAEAIAPPRTGNRPAVATADIIAVARSQGARSSFTPAQHRQALDLANRLHRRAISIAEAEIAKGKRVRGVNMELVNNAERVLNALKGAQLVDGAETCGVRADGQASVSPFGGQEVFICPQLLLQRNSSNHRDEEIIFILVHEAAHLAGLMAEADADEAAATILGYSLAD